MSYAELKKVCNDDFSKPLNKLFGLSYVREVYGESAYNSNAETTLLDVSGIDGVIVFQTHLGTVSSSGNTRWGHIYAKYVGGNGYVMSLASNEVYVFPLTANKRFYISGTSINSSSTSTTYYQSNIKGHIFSYGGGIS